MNKLTIGIITMLAGGAIIVIGDVLAKKALAEPIIIEEI